MNFQTSLVARPEKGTLNATDSSLVVTNANSVTFILTAATSFVNYLDISGDPAARCEKILEGVKDKSFKELKNIHLSDFSNLMGRVALKIGDPMMNKRPTDERLADLRKGIPDRISGRRYTSLAVISWFQAAEPADSRPICREYGMRSYCQIGVVNIPLTLITR